MNDQIAIQYALFRASRSYSGFADQNIVLGREYLASKIQQDAVWVTPAPSGKVGIGAIIQIPALMFPKPNSLQREREFRIGIYEEPDSNFTPDLGTLRAADDWADLWIDFLWNWTVWRSSGLILQDRAVVPDTRFADQGIVGVQAICVLRQERRPLPRAATPVITKDMNSLVNLTVTDGSTIYYTTDGFSTPAPDNNGTLPGEQAALKYVAPVAVPAGSVVLACAFANNLLPSQVAAYQT